MLEAKKTTYMVDGCEEPCWEVSNGYTMVRIAKYYHYIGDDTMILTEYLDGEWNNQEEWSESFDSLYEKLNRLEEAYQCYLEAAMAKDRYALQQLSEMYRKGIYVPEDKK